MKEETYKGEPQMITKKEIEYLRDFFKRLPFEPSCVLVSKETYPYWLKMCREEGVEE